MAIHYIGPLAPQPGRRACGEASGQAESYDLHATDCGGCKTALLGVQIIHGEPGSIPMRIAEVTEHQVALTTFGTDRMWVPWHKLDVPNPWHRHAPEPEQ